MKRIDFPCGLGQLNINWPFFYFLLLNRVNTDRKPVILHHSIIIKDNWAWTLAGICWLTLALLSQKQAIGKNANGRWQTWKMAGNHDYMVFLLLAFAAYVMLNLSNKNLCQISSHRPFHSYGQTLTWHGSNVLACDWNVVLHLKILGCVFLWPCLLFCASWF